MKLPVSTILQVLKAVVPMVVDLVKPKKRPTPDAGGAGELGDRDVIIQLDAARNAGHEKPVIPRK